MKRYRITLFINAVAPAILDQRPYTLLTEDDMIATLVMYYLYVSVHKTGRPCSIKEN